MTSNVGGIDRIIRIVLGFVILSLVALLEGRLRWLGLLGLVPLITGLAGWCPAYTLFHISSYPKQTHKPA